MLGDGFIWWNIAVCRMGRLGGLGLVPRLRGALVYRLVRSRFGRRRRAIGAVIGFFRRVVFDCVGLAAA
ncbi:hypothetical protein D3C73_539900 [compost metagenome]